MDNHLSVEDFTLHPAWEDCLPESTPSGTETTQFWIKSVVTTWSLLDCHHHHCHHRQVSKSKLAVVLRRGGQLKVQGEDSCRSSDTYTYLMLPHRHHHHHHHHNLQNNRYIHLLTWRSLIIIITFNVILVSIIKITINDSILHHHHNVKVNVRTPTIMKLTGDTLSSLHCYHQAHTAIQVKEHFCVGFNWSRSPYFQAPSHYQKIQI